MKYLLLCVLMSTSLFILAQGDKDFLHATVTLKNKKTYTGQIRLNNNAGAWDDMFEAYKNEPQIQEQIDIQGYEKSEESSSDIFELSFMKLWENKDHKSRFTFKCQFGHIDRIVELRDNKYASIWLKNGKKIKVRRRGNDIGSDIIMFHNSLGRLEFDWKNIKEIDFKSAPKSLKNYNGSKIYGNALTIDGPIEGYVVWDFDEEAFYKDIIDGYHQNVEYELDFGKIASLQPEREGALVTLNNGTELFLRNSSDVNKDNDGIFIKTERRGMVNLNWSNLIKIEFTKPRYKSREYDEFGSPKSLNGKIETIDGKSYQGKLAYDLDEVWDIEILDGKSKGVKYFIPFYLIESISPQNYNYSLIKLTNGTSLMLGEEGDVNHQNNGILVWLNDSKTKYVPWKNIKSLTFKHK